MRSNASSWIVLSLCAAAGCSSSNPASSPDSGPDASDDAGPGASDDTGPGASDDAAPGTSADAAPVTPSEAGSEGGSVRPEAGPDAGPPTTLSVVTVTGNACTISSTTTWTPAVYVVNCNIDVMAALVIDAGTVLKFGPSYSVTVEPTGTVDAVGNAANPIVFTSLRDDAVAGDTNGDGTATSPAPADWGGVTNNNDGSKFDHCAFYYAGSGGPALRSRSNGAMTSITVTNSVFAHNRTTTPSLTSAPALDLSNASAPTVVTGNVFYDNVVPMAINGAFSVDDSNVFDNAAAAPSMPQPNTYNGIVISNGNAVTGISLKATKVPFVVNNTNYNLSVTDNGALTLGDNVIFKFPAGGSISIGVGGTIATGNGDVFTSIRDDAHGGDTNGDGNVTQPSATDWNGAKASQPSSNPACVTLATEYYETCQ